MTQITNNLPAIKEFFVRDDVKNKFKELLGNNAPSYITAIMQVVNGNNLLSKADPVSIYQSAAMAAILGLQVHPTLGQAWIVPYAGKAQFQIGYKGLVQLAHRSGEYKKINVKPVYKNQFKFYDGLYETFDADFSIMGEGQAIGYVALFELTNGFQKLSYWTREAVSAHGKRYSQSFSNPKAPWVTNFDQMAMKTVLKDMLVHWGPLSVEMRRAIEADQSVVNDADNDDFEYPDNDISNWKDVSQNELSEDFKRSVEFLQACVSKLDLSNLQTKIPTERFSEYEKKEWTNLFQEKFNSL